MKTLINCAAVGTLLAGAQLASAEQSKPNVMFIFADDQTFESIGAYGLTEVKRILVASFALKPHCKSI